MAKFAVKNGQTSNVFRVKILDSTSTAGAGKTGLAFNTSGLLISTMADNESSATVYSTAGSTIETIATTGTFAAPTATKCRFKEVDATNHPGTYELQFADARFAVSNAKKLYVTISGATGAAQCDVEIELFAVDPYDSVRHGMTALPNAAAEAAGGLFTRGTGAGQINQDANGRVDVNAKAWIGGTIPAVNVTGVPKVDVVDWLGSAPDALSSGKVPADLKLWLTSAPLVLSSQLVQVIVNDYASGKVPLQPTTAGRTLDVAATGEAGLDFDNIKLARGATTLTNIRVPAVTLTDTVTTYTGNTVQTGDSYARLGAPSGASIAADIAAVPLAVWNTLRSVTFTVGSFGEKFKAWLATLGADNKVLLSSDTQTGVVLPRVTLTDTVTTYTGNTPQTGDVYALANSGTSGFAALKTLIDTANTALTNGTYGLSALQVALAALQTSVSNIANNTSTRLVVAPMLEIPDASTVTYELDLLIMDETGNMEAPDSTPTVTAKNAAGTDRSSGLSALTLISTGHYSLTYTLSSTDSPEQLVFTAVITEGAVARKAIASSTVANADITGTATKVNSIYADYARRTGDYATPTNVTDAAASVTLAASQASYAPAKAGDAMALTSGERTTLAASFWNALTSGLSTAGSIGKRLVDFVTTLIYIAPDNTNIGVAATQAAAAATSAATAATQATTAATQATQANTKATAIQGAGFDTTTDSLEAIRNRGDAAWTTGAGGGGGGTGTFALTITAVPNARVSLVDTGLAATAGTDGLVTFNVDAGTYAVRVAPPLAYAVPADTPVTVNDDTEVTIELAAASWPDPSTSELCVCRRVVRAGSTVRAGITHKFQATADGPTAGESQQEVRSAVSDESGLIEIELLRGVAYREWHDRAPALSVTYTVPDASTYELPAMRDGL